MVNNLDKKAPFFVVSGPSGSGKTTICREIANEFGWYFSISHTTRAQRKNERDGYDYYFVDEASFKEMMSRGEFLEWAQVYGNFYGTSKKIIEQKLSEGCGVILDVDTQGAANIKKLMPQAVLIFIKTKTLDDLKMRLEKRGRDATEDISRRLKNAQTEMSHTGEYDHVICNDELIAALTEMRKIIANHS